MPTEQLDQIEPSSMTEQFGLLREFRIAIHEISDFSPDPQDPRYARRGRFLWLRSFFLYSWVLLVMYFAGGILNLAILALQQGIGAVFNTVKVSEIFLLGQVLQVPVLGVLLFVALLVIPAVGLLAYSDLRHEHEVLSLRAKAMERGALIDMLNNQLATTRQEIAARQMELAEQADLKADQLIDISDIDSAGELATQVQKRTAKAARNAGPLSDDERKKIGEYVLNETLLIALRSPKPRTRKAVVEYIAKLGDLAPAEPVIVSLGDPDRDVREAARRTIKLIQPDKVLLPLEAALQTSDTEGRKAALWALGQLGNRVPIDTIVNALHDTEPDIRIEAITILGNTADHAPVEPLIEMLKDEQWEVRKAAIEALVMMADHAPVEPLIEMLKDEQWEVREAAVLALGTFKDQAPIDLIASALEDISPDVRRSARWVLWSLGIEPPSDGTEEEE